MKIIETGCIYELSNFDDPNTVQTITFASKRLKDEKTGEMELVHDGTIDEEVIEMLIDRLEYLHLELPIRDSIEATTHLNRILASIQGRVLERKQRENKEEFIR